MSKIPTIYIDTTVYRDYFTRRNEETIHLIKLIRDRKWKCFTSIFTAMEFVDIEKDAIFFNKKIRVRWEINKIIRARQQKDLNRGDLEEAEVTIKKIFEELDFVELVNLESNEAWDVALSISCNSNLSASDVVHLATAWQSNCDVVVTSDEFFIKEGNLVLERGEVWDKFKICKPHKVQNVLAELGFENL